MGSSDEEETARDVKRPSDLRRQSSDKPRRRESEPPKKAKRRVPDEPTPVISGRFLTAAVIVLGLTVLPMSTFGSLFEPKDPTIPTPNTWTVGSKATIAVTLITADYNKLFCAHDKEFAGFHCGFKSENEPWPRDLTKPLDDNKATVVQPYRTWLDNQLVLIAGLWAQPAVATRLHREPAGGVEEDKLARFVVECQVTFVGKMDGVKLRWGPGQWTNPDMNPMLARPDSCKLIEAEAP
jgi:hypothetical protein